MPKMVCVNCQTELQIEKTGVFVIEMFLDPPVPYKIWNADLWQCPGCHTEIVSGFASHQLVEHYEDDFEDMYKAILENKPNTVFFDYYYPLIIYYFF